MKVALIHDWLPFMGGAERVLTNFVEMYPDAPIYTTICNKNKLDSPLKDANIIVSNMGLFDIVNFVTFCKAPGPMNKDLS